MSVKPVLHVPPHSLWVRDPAVGWQVMDTFVTLQSAGDALEAFHRDHPEYSAYVRSIDGRQQWEVYLQHEGTHNYLTGV